MADALAFWTLATAALSQCSYKGWHFHVEAHPERPFLQVEFLAPDPVDGIMTLQKGRKWPLSNHMSRDEVIQSALKAVLTAEEHETRENFLYKGLPVFGPHYNIDRLAEVLRAGGISVREAPPSSDVEV